MKNQAVKLLTELKARNLIFDCTNEEKFLTALAENKKLYLGFDPTAESLHLGNYVGICFLKHFAKYGFKTIAVLGGATGLIGDPSFKNQERKLLPETTISTNGEMISKQLLKYSGCEQVVNNYDFYVKMNVLTFLRDVGKLINVSYLMEKEALKERFKTGLSYTEFTYPLLQGWDFKYLYNHYNVSLQAGGSDQWGNITTGIEIIRKLSDTDVNVAGITFPLLTDSHGQKFGKSEGNALFLNSKLTHPYLIYQFLLNSSDEDVSKYLKVLTFLSLSEIEQVVEAHQSNLKNRLGQKTLAFELVKDLHGIQAAEDCVHLSQILFTNELMKLTKDNYLALSHALKVVEVEASIKVVNALVELELATSAGNARQLIMENAISLVDQKVFDPTIWLTPNHGRFGYVLLRKGKKKYGLIKFKEG